MSMQAGVGGKRPLDNRGYWSVLTSGDVSQGVHNFAFQTHVQRLALVSIAHFFSSHSDIILHHFRQENIEDFHGSLGK
jgi:hypothetical protein